MKVLEKLKIKSKPGLDGVAFGAVAAAAVLLAGVFVVRSEPRAEVEMRLADGSVWLPSVAIGGVSLLDGSTGSIATSLGVAEQGEDFEVEQWGSDAILVNETAGTVSRLDGADWTIATGRVQFGEPGVALEVLAGDEAGWLVQPGTVAPLDLETLEQRSASPIAGTLSEGLVTEDGSLLYSSLEVDTPLRRFSADGQSNSTISGMTGPVALRDLGGIQTGVDLDDHRVWLEGSGIVCSKLEFPAGAKLGVGGGDGQLLVVSDQGGLMMWSPGRSGCPGSDEFVSIEAGNYGTPVVTDGWGVVPDFGRSEVVVIDIGAQSVVTRRSITGLADGASFDLVAEAGAVWFNDPFSTVAGLVRRGQEVLQVSKYEQGSDSGFVAAPVDDPDLEGQSLALANGGSAEDGAASSAGTAEAPLVTQRPVDPLGPTVEQTTTTEGPGGPTASTAPPATGGKTPSTTGSGPGSTTTPSTVEPPVTPPQVIDIQVGVSAAQVNEGDSITFQSITVTGNPRFYDLTVSPDNGSLADLISFGRFDYTFPIAGDYLVTLEACDPDDFCDSETVAIKVIPPDVVVELVAGPVDPGSVTVDEAVTFFDASQGDVTGRSWTFQGGTPATSTAQNPSVTFGTTGTKQVTLTVTGEDGSSNTATINVEVVDKAPPYLLTIVGDTTVQAGDTAGYSVTTSNPNGLPNPHWNVQGADSITPNGAALEASWSVAGTYLITVETSDGSAEGAGALTVTVTAAPVVDPAPDVVVSGPATLEAGQAGNWSVNNSGGSIASYDWQVSGGVTGANATIAHTFPTAGTYTVTVTATGPGGDDTASRTITVTEAVVPEAPFDMACSSATVGFIFGCDLVGNPADFTNFNWSMSWPDPSQASSWQMSPYSMDLQYDVPGQVSVTLTAVDAVTLNPVSKTVSVNVTSVATTTTTEATTTTTEATTTTTEATTTTTTTAPTTTTTALQPAVMNLSCQTVAVGSNALCQVSNASSFTGFSWGASFPVPANGSSWPGSPGQFYLSYSEIASFGVSASATDNVTGTIVSRSATVSFQ